MAKKILICIDRDGVLTYDKKYHLGHTNRWRSRVKILPTVVEGLKVLNSIPNVAIYMISNQPGVAIKDFRLLTLERAHTVAKHIVERLHKRGGHLHGYFICPHASPAYTRKRSQYKFHKRFVCRCACIKPRLGMIFMALRSEGLTRENTRVFVIGDRATDIKTALNIKGIGVLVPFVNEPGQVEKVKKMKPQSRIHIAKDFLDAAKYIKRRSKK